MELTGKKVFVTGGGGFIGSHLVEALVKRGCQVTAFTHYNSLGTNGWLDHVEKEVRDAIEIIPGDIRDAYCVKKAMQGADVVFHLSALIGIPYSYYSPEAYVATNVQGTLNVLQAARELNVKKVVHTSTSEVYGTAQFVPITELHPINPQSPYAASKAGADFLALSFHRSFDLPVAIIRPFNTYGPRQSARAIIPTIITQILSGKREIQLGSLHPNRDLNFVTDTVAGFIAAAESDQSIGEICNIGSGKEISMKELVALIKRLMESDIAIIEDPLRKRPGKSEVERLLASPQKARELLQWESRVDLENGLKKTIAWFSNKDNLALYASNKYAI